MINPAFGRFLREQRKESRISLRAFAAEIDVDPSNYSKIERGVLQPPEGEILERIGDALKIPRGTSQWQYFTYLADTARGDLPEDIVGDEAVAAALPAFFQRLRKERLRDPEQMYRAFISVVRED
jgi:transcriptional regulator with XRE-family HTH domain